MKKIYALTLLLFFVLEVFSQVKNGVVVAKDDNKPLPFATIITDSIKNEGKISDIDGEFTVDESKITYIKVGYVGFKTRVIKLSSLNSYFLVTLEPDAFRMDEIVVTPGENPAHKIIRLIKKNKSTNNPDNINSYKTEQYLKLTARMKLKNVKGYTKHEIDSINRKQWKNKDLFFSESIYNRYYKKHGLNKIILKANKTSGVKSVPFFLGSESLQPVHFYSDVIKLLDKDYLNPIGVGCFVQYRYHLVDSVMIDGNKIYTINFWPKNKNRVEVLKGTFKISSDRYAIYSVVAEPYNKSLVDLKIEQKYKRYPDYWFPNEMNYELIYNDVKALGVNYSLNYSGRTYFKGVEFNNTDKVRFNSDWLVYEDNVIKNDSLYWNNARLKPLLAREKRTYAYLDSTINEGGLGFDKIMVVAEKLTEGKIPYGKFDIDLLKIYNQNHEEDTRLGFGLSTNEKLSQYISIGGYIGYGSEDEKYKYGGNLRFNLYSPNRLSVNLSYINDFIQSDGYEGFTDYFIMNFDKYEQYKADFSGTLKFLDFNFSLAKQNIKHFEDEGDIYFPGMDYCEIGADLTFDFYRRDMPSFYSKFKRIRGRANETTAWPVFGVSYRQGISGLLDGDYDYKSVVASVENYSHLRFLGEIEYRIEAGKIFGDLTLPKLYKGNKVFSEESAFYFENTFQTVEMNEFVNSEYLYLFFYYNIGAVKTSSKYFKPKFSVAQHIGYGKLNDKDKFNYNDMSKGLFEAGIVVNDIIRFPVFNIIYVGGGISSFYRYGKYKHSDDKNNFSVKANITIGF